MKPTVPNRFKNIGKKGDNVERHANLEAYRHDSFNEVSGWVSERLFSSVSMIGEIQEAINVVGDVGEIGVHHGKFLLLLDCLRRDDEISVGFDIFDFQELNIDRSGRGSLAAFQKN